MATRGAQSDNTNAEKEHTGKPFSVYLSPDALLAIKSILRDRGEDTSEKSCIKEARKHALEGIEDFIRPVPIAPEVEHLRYMVSNWQALANIAEVFAPHLLNNDKWIGLKLSLEQRTDKIGVTEFIRQKGEEYREKIEAEDDEDL